MAETSTSRSLENWLKSYAQFTSTSEAPDLFNFWTGVSVIAGALRRQVWIDELKFKWTPNFYIVFVAPPGVATKSTTMGVGESLLRQVKGVKFGPSSMTWQGLTTHLAASMQLIPFDDDYIPMSCLTCMVSELGTFLRPEDDELISVLIDLWDGREVPWERVTKTQGETRIENPWINIIGSTTPAWLRDNFGEAMIGGGLTSRIVFVYADKKKQLVPYVSDTITSDSYADLRTSLIHDLELIAQMKGEFRLTPEAKQLGREWYEMHWTSTPEHLRGERMGGYVARKQTHIHKLAMVLSAARSSELVIEQQDLELSLNLITGTEHDMMQVFQSVGMGLAARQVEELISYVRAYKRVPQQTVWRFCMRVMSYKDFSEAIKAAVQAGYLTITQDGDKTVWFNLKKDPKGEIDVDSN